MSLDQVPDEIIKHVLYYVSPEDNLASFQVLSRRLNRLANDPLLWKHHCQHAFRYWNPRHEFQRKLRKRAYDVEWKQLFILRKSQNSGALRLLNRGIETKVGRLRRFEQICKLGYDAKDFLLEQSRTDESAEDVLARRFWSKSLLNSVHRVIAIEEWYKLRVASETSTPSNDNRSLERVLGAFDMFVLYDQPGDLDDISHILDDWTLQFRRSTPYLHVLPPRQKALALNQWLRLNNLTGLRDPERSYRNLRNCFIGQALRHGQHESLPIISSAIFCCMAERLGIRAQCCAFPTHVHVIVLPEPGMTLDGEVVQQPSTDKMYLDPYGSDEEVPASALEDLLVRFGWQTSTDIFLAPVPANSVAVRTAHNIKASFMRASELREEAHPELSRLLAGHDGINMETAYYSSLWAILMLTPVNAHDWADHLDELLHRFSKHWSEDTWLIEKYICPLFQRLSPLRERFPRNGLRSWDDPWRVINLVRELDLMTPPLSHRNQDGSQDAAYKIGQVFRHRRYGWLGVINGWTDRGRRRLPIPDAVAIDEGLSDTELPSVVRPLNHTFYTSLRPMGIDRHIVAESNIELVHDPNVIPESLFLLAGKFFKRFDREKCRFVSNLHEEYPSD